ncbi:MAG: glycosyltransferase family 2 protein, partial [Minisyncoccia bacterium]
MSTFNRSPEVLRDVLQSIKSRVPPGWCEVIVVDDGSDSATAKDLCKEYRVQYHRIDRPPVRRNPCVARNVAYRAARGEYLILQSDDVVHVTEDAIDRLVSEAEHHP